MKGSPLECAIFCLISNAVIFQPKFDNKKCTYCVDVRPIVSECQNNPFECQDTNPEGIIYCLNVFEYSSKVQSTVRCISIWDLDFKNITEIYTNLSTSIDILRQVQSTQCTQRLMKNCNCSSCIREIEGPIKNVNENKLSINKTDIINIKENIKANDTGSLQGLMINNKVIIEEIDYEKNEKIPSFIIFEYGKNLFGKLFNSNNNSSIVPKFNLIILTLSIIIIFMKLLF
uniref:Uncharacterized protein n=1 Tax=Parastrongyloides trichosuri TaxID=131310 RepID=A0A0N4ZJR5_PARTI